MPTGQEYGEALRDISSWVEKVGFDITGDVDDEDSEGNSVDGYVIEAANRQIVILGSPNRDWFQAEIQVDVRGDYLQQDYLEQKVSEHDLDTPEKIQEYLESEGGVEIEDATHEDFLEAAESEIHAIDENELRFAMISHLAQESNIYQLSAENGVIFGFDLSRKLFVYEDNYTKEDLFEQLQSIVNYSIPARKLLYDAYGVGEIQIEDGDESGELKPSEDRTFM